MNDLKLSTVKHTPPTILIVDDDFTARFGMGRALGSRYRVLEAESVSTARQIMVQENPHLLLLDIEMPEEGGLDLLGNLGARVEG